MSLNLGSPPWCREGALDLWSKGQQFEPRRWQLEKVVNLDENSWTPTKIIKKRSFSEAQKHWRGWDDNACLGVRNTSSIGAWHNSLDGRPPWYCIVSPLLQNKTKFFYHLMSNFLGVISDPHPHLKSNIINGHSLCIILPWWCLLAMPQGEKIWGCLYNPPDPTTSFVISGLPYMSVFKAYLRNLSLC